MLLLIWMYVIGISIPPFFGWGGYASEGVLVTCTYDYLKDVSVFPCHHDFLSFSQVSKVVYFTPNPNAQLFLINDTKTPSANQH